ncbi:collagen alpha-1(XVIII) chain-like, partial [Tropilaelaps mercedesae]
FECHEIDLLYEVHPTDSTPGVRKATSDRRSSSPLLATLTTRDNKREHQHWDADSDGYEATNLHLNNNANKNSFHNAISLALNSNVRIPHRLVLPAELPHHFMLSSRLKSESPLGGFLFAVLDSSDTVIQLGLYMHPVDNFKQNITIYYSDTRRNNPIAEFVIDDLTGSWI